MPTPAADGTNPAISALVSAAGVFTSAAGAIFSEPQGGGSGGGGNANVAAPTPTFPTFSTPGVPFAGGGGGGASVSGIPLTPTASGGAVPGATPIVIASPAVSGVVVVAPTLGPSGTLRSASASASAASASASAAGASSGAGSVIATTPSSRLTGVVYAGVTVASAFVALML
ncbi:hypothetical protein HDU87_006153 [Geranomyces variabilis]|uniref:Uncharacterized protein n=1 Tax=Geranomyces variabilis TaxID=109894 RepID=A0AAD5THD9_9FUNG|nr:hypothetical protein HDU87_006153 [Geranomyces variabilis]